MPWDVTNEAGGGGSGGWLGQNVIYVGKHGNDANSGLDMANAKLTFGNAIATAVAATPTANNRYTIFCEDAGRYTENISTPSYVSLFAPNAILIGNSNVGGDCQWYVRGLESGPGGGAALNLGPAGAQRAQVTIGYVLCTGAAYGFNAPTGSCRLDVGVITVENGYAINHAGATTLAAYIGDIVITGTGVGLYVGAGSGNLIAYVGSITDSGSGFGCVNGSPAQLDAYIGYLACNTRWNFTNGTNRLFITEAAAGAEPSVTGLQLTLAGEIRETGTPTDLTIAAIADGEYLRRSGTTIAGAAGVTTAEQLFIPVRKGTAGSIAAFTPVYPTGYNVGGWVEVEAADAANAATMPSIGIANTAITNAATVNLINSGTIGSLDTSTPGYSVGDPLYVASGGGVTNVRPTGATTQVQKFGEVLRVNLVNGEVLVVGAGRANDIKNLTTARIWEGDGTGVAVEVDPDLRYDPALHGVATHQNGGTDEFSVAGLSGELADAQPVQVEKAGVLVGTRKILNFIEGSNITLTIVDDSTEIDITIAASGGSGGLGGTLRTMSLGNSGNNNNGPMQNQWSYCGIIIPTTTCTVTYGHFGITQNGSGNVSVVIFSLPSTFVVGGGGASTATLISNGRSATTGAGTTGHYRLAFSTPPTLTAGTCYGVGLHCDNNSGPRVSGNTVTAVNSGHPGNFYTAAGTPPTSSTCQPTTLLPWVELEVA